MTRNERHRKQKKKLWRRALLCSIFILLIGLASYIGTICIDVKQYDQVFASNVWIHNVSIGGLTPLEAEEKVTKELLLAFGNQEITLKGTANISPIPLKYSGLGVTYNLKEILSSAFLIGHEGDFFERYQSFKSPSEEPITLTLTPAIETKAIEVHIAPHLEAFYKAPVNAKMERKNRAFHITPEAPGHKADMATTAQQIEKLIQTNSEGEITVPLLPIAAEYTTSYFKQLQVPLASFSTSYNNADPQRNINLELASRKINTMLLPNEKFMFSKQLEPITEKAGYKTSKVILNGNFEDGIGGGICQVSSTLYNALILTDIDIYMRRNHSLPVGYTPLGQDATYATDSVDFQFINNTGYPLYVESYCENNKVYVTLYGHKSFKPDYEARFESEVVEIIQPPATKYEEDPNLAPGTQVQKVRPKSGQKVVLYKNYYKNNNLIKKEKLNTSVYKAQGEIIRRGSALKAKNNY